MATTYDKIASTTLGSAANYIDFTSIPATYTDLRISFVPKGTDIPIYITFNSDTGSNYSNTRLQGDGSAASSGRQTSQTSIRVGTVTGTSLGFYQYDIFSYAGSTFKTLLSNENNDQNGSGTIVCKVGLWRSTSAITDIRLDSATTNGLTTGTIATLYGILKA